MPKRRLGSGDQAGLIAFGVCALWLAAVGALVWFLLVPAIEAAG